MNNFSELQATDISLPLSITLTPHYKTHAPEVTVCIGGIICYTGILNNQIQLTQLFPLQSVFDIEIHLQNKNDLDDCTTGVIISDLNVDGNNLVPDWTHLAHYTNDRDLGGPAAHLGFNGVWKLCVNRPFYQWWHINTSQGWLLEPEI
jgi:hypothetical protein